MLLDPRTRTILQAVVETYLEDAVPVSSSAVLRRQSGLGMSSATVRTIMAQLEETGYLAQPHTSAGRVPTELGWRAYLDGLMSPRLRPWDRNRLEAATAQSRAENFALELGESLASLSHQVAVVAVPRFLGTRLKEVGLARCDARRVLAYFVSPSGLVQQKLIELDSDMSADELTRIQNMLNDRLGNRTLHEVRALVQQELRGDYAQRDELERRAFCLAEQMLPDNTFDVVVVGTPHLLEQPEFADVSKLHAALRAIEEKRTVLKLIEEALDGSGVKVVLSSEHHVEELSALSLVGSAWTSASGPAGAISLLGPARMDYGRLVPLVGYATHLFGRYWERL